VAREGLEIRAAALERKGGARWMRGDGVIQ
jgi:hypothetical protein